MMNCQKYHGFNTCAFCDWHLPCARWPMSVLEVWLTPENTAVCVSVCCFYSLHVCFHKYTCLLFSFLIAYLQLIKNKKIWMSNKGKFIMNIYIMKRETFWCKKRNCKCSTTRNIVFFSFYKHQFKKRKYKFLAF